MMERGLPKNVAVRDTDAFEFQRTRNGAFGITAILPAVGNGETKE
jgi:hypothetical protein